MPKTDELAGATVADVTNDGHPDAVLVVGNGGSAGCGEATVVAWVRGRTRVIFRHGLCESSVRGVRGGVVLDVPVGACPYKYGSAHCVGGRREELWRWNGRALALSRVRVTCVLKRLDPHRACAPRRR
jgi:hypothetical protein